MSEPIQYGLYPGFQQEALFSFADFLLVAGEAGPGKSFWLVFEAPYDYREGPVKKLYEIPNYTSLIIRKESTQMEKLRLMATPIYTKLGFVWHGQPANCFVHPEFNSKIYFRGLQYDDSYLQFQGWDIHDLRIDEITQFNRVALITLFSWVRSAIPAILPRVRATANAVGLGVEWVKQIWNIKCPCLEHKGRNQIFYRDQEFAEVEKVAPGPKFSFQFINAVKRGSFIEKVEKEQGQEGKYEAMLGMLHGGSKSPMFKALARGCWEVQKGAFWGEFSSLHVIPDDLEFKGFNWVWGAGHDFATSDQGDACAMVLGRANDRKDVIIEGEAYFWGLGVEEQTIKFEDLYKKAAFAYSGYDIFAENQGGGTRTIAEQFRLNGFNFVMSRLVLKNAASLVRSGLRATLYKREGGTLYIRARCKRLIEDFRLMIADIKDPDVWDIDYRVTIPPDRRYHFDVFRAFTTYYCAVFGADMVAKEEGPMNPDRRQAIKEIEEKETADAMDCSYVC